EDGSFKPNNSITRAEFVAMLYNSALVDTSDTDAEIGFADVTGNEWYAKYLDWAVENGIITGYEDNTFRGNNIITRQEMAVVVSKFAALTGKELENYVDITFTDEADIAPWAKPYVDDISEKAIVKGDNYGNFNPKKNLTRAETAVIITNIKGN
ncbi:MAG: S-layer homology domain-containing protein, partial [Firmicutes bacterium]|nr:S-layer homology domain-containing protein [Bacillota bacterium]